MGTLSVDHFEVSSVLFDVHVLLLDVKSLIPSFSVCLKPNANLAKIHGSNDGHPIDRFLPYQEEKVQCACTVRSKGHLPLLGEYRPHPFCEEMP